MKPRYLFVCSLLIGVCAPLASADNFRTLQPDTLPKGWTPFGTATWGIVNNGASQVYQATGPALPGPFASTRTIELAKDVGFTLSTTFRVTAGTSHPGNEYIGFVAFANQATLSSSSYYLADVQRGSGIIRILSLGSDNPDFTAEKISTFIGTLDENKDYTLTLVATPSAGGLTLKLSLSDGKTTTSVTATDPTPFNGSEFGFRINNAAAGESLKVGFADFVLTPSETITR